MPAPGATVAATGSPRAPAVASSSISSPSPAKEASVSVAATAATGATAAAGPLPPAAQPSPPASTMGSTSIKEALDRFEKAKSLPPGSSSATEKVELWGQCPPIEKLDASLGKLEACKCVFPFFFF